MNRKALIKSREADLAYVKERLTEKGYREFLAYAVSHDRVNWQNFERKSVKP
ncbi:MAG TPA: hypothetical protein VGK59_18640 [Ohtaekwangia sp.]